MDLRKESLSFRTKFKNIKYSELEKGYLNLCDFLNKYYDLEKGRTKFEFVLYKLMKGISKLHIHRSFWIGKRNVDFFIPSLGGDIRCHGKRNLKRFNGLVIEIDGEIHDTYSKMRRDESKYDQLSALNIGSMVIENDDLKHPVVSSLLDSIPKLKKIDTRARKRLLRNIYLETIISHKKLILKHSITPCVYTLKALREI